MSTVEAPGGRIFDLVTRRRLGITQEAVEASLKARKAAGEFVGWTKENLREKLDAKGQELALSVCGDIQACNEQAWCDAHALESQPMSPAVPKKVDWEAVLAFVAKLLEMLMPIFVKV